MLGIRITESSALELLLHYAAVTWIDFKGSQSYCLKLTLKLDLSV